MSQFCLSLSGVKLKWVFMQCSERLGKLITDPAVPFPSREPLSSWGVPFWH